MIVNPIVYQICFECSDIDNQEYDYTVQYLREINIPMSRSSWGRHSPQPKYVCGDCGGENWG